MKPYIHTSFWSDEDIEPQPAEIKLAALWIITNNQTSILGICQASSRRFAFETGLTEDVLKRACEALPRAFIGVGNVIFIRNYIRHQFGCGESLMRNNFFNKLSSAFLGVSEDIQKVLLANYPEFSETAINSKGLQRASKALDNPKDRIGREGNGKEGIGKTDLQIRAEKLFNRRQTTPWGASELRAWTSNKKAVEATEEQEWAILEWLYAKPLASFPYRRQDLATLINNWQAEITRAQGWKLGGNGAPKPSVSIPLEDRLK